MRRRSPSRPALIEASFTVGDSSWRRRKEGLPAFVPVTVAPSMPEPAPVSARAAITIAFGANFRMTIEGSPDEITLANVIGVLAGDRRPGRAKLTER
jgi:hypothetical protein